MHIFLCIDDTDNLDSRGTGELAELIAAEIEAKGFGKCSRITRHQLYIHPDIPYTSHNSSMCFEADIDEKYYDEIVDYASTFLKKESAEGSDPGLCIAVPDKILKPELLIDFGKRAKKEIVTIQKAYALGKELGVHLSEHGGTGQGVIGALAGVGLRMTGNDGRFKGKIKLKSESGMESVEYLLSQTGFQRVKDIKGEDLKNDEMVIIGEALKAVLLDRKSTILVHRVYDEVSGKAQWKTCNKQQLSTY